MIEFSELHPEIDFHHDLRGQSPKNFYILARPNARLYVDGAKRTKRLPGWRDQRDARIGDHVEIAHGEIVANQGILTSVADNKRLIRAGDVLTEGVRERRFALLRPFVREPDLALKKLAIGIDQRHQCHWNLKYLRRQFGQMIKDFLGWGIEETGSTQFA